MAHWRELLGLRSKNLPRMKRGDADDPDTSKSLRIGRGNSASIPLLLSASSAFIRG
jgi:hypothetical protein